MDRRIELDGTINTRDLGGHKTRDGRMVRYHLFLRSDTLDHLSEKDMKTLSDDYHLGFDVDLRSDEEVKNRPDVAIPSSTFIHAPITKSLATSVPDEAKRLDIKDPALKGIVAYIYYLDSGGDSSVAMERVYEDFLLSEQGRRNYSLLFKTMLRLDEGESIIFHCTDGKDRTGIASMLFLSILGVDEEAIIDDYLLTNECVKMKKREQEHKLRDIYHVTDEILIRSVVDIAGVRRNWIEAAISALKRDYQDIENYFMKGLSFTREEIKQLRDIALVDEIRSNPVS